VITVALIVAAYLLGAVPTSYLAGRLGRGIDLREHGSRNLGATNAWRVLGAKYAVPVALFDIFKGWAPVALFPGFAGESIGTAPVQAVAFGIAAIAGHVFSPYVRFRGGKGVATTGGVFLGLAPLAVVIAMAVWGVVFYLSGYVSLGSITTALTLPLWVWVTVRDPAERGPFTTASGALALFIVFTHRRNLKRLLAGTESRFRTRKGEQ
jgi:acyl phosphate:glycerol-3-phosphate acyltransferase